MSIPARKAVPLTRAKAYRLRIENIKERRQGEAEIQSVERERLYP